MGFNMQKLMQQAQKMQRDMNRVQEELKTTELEGSAGGGMVKVLINGASEVQRIHIDPSVVDPDDVEMLEDLVLAAFSDALEKAQALSSDKMGAVTGGMGGGGMGLPGMRF